MRRHASRGRVVGLLVVLGLGLLAASPAYAQQTTFTWSNSLDWDWNLTSPDWNGGASTWVNDDTSSPGSVALFNSAGNGVTVSSGIQANGIIINNAGYSFAGGDITLGAGGITANQSATFSTPMTFAANQTWNVASGANLTVGNLADGGKGYGLTLNGAGTLSLNGTSYTYGGPTVVSGGTLAMLGGNPWAASNGVVAHYAFDSNTNDSGPNGLTATLQNGPATYTTGKFGQAIQLNGTSQFVTVPYNAALGLNAFTTSIWVNVGSTYPATTNGGPALISTRNGGDTTFDVQYWNNNGTYELHADVGSGGGWINTNMNYTLPAAFTPGTWNMVTYTVSSAGYAIYVNGQQVATGGVGGTPLFMKSGQTLAFGSQEAGGNNWGSAGYFNGALDDAGVFSGVLSQQQITSLYLNEVASLPAATALTVASGATFNAGSTPETVAGLSGSGNIVLGNNGSLTVNGPAPSTFTFGGVVSGSGSFGQAGTGTFLSLTGSNTYTGGTVVSGGTLQAGNPSALGTGGLFTSGGVLDLNGYSYTFSSLNGSGGTVLNNSASTPATLTVNGSGTYGGLVANGAGGLSLVKSGAGTLTLTSNNTYGGGTTVAAGTLQLGTGAAGQDGSLGTGNVANSGALVYDLNGAQTANYAITGNGSLTKSGTGTLALTNTNNSYSGGTTLSAGILNFAANTVPCLASTSIYFNGGTLQWALANTQDVSAYIAPIVTGQAAILDTNGNNVTFNTPISGAGGLTKAGAGMLTLAVGNSYNGATTVSGGTLQAGNQSALGTSGLVATSGGVLDLNGYSFTLSSLTGSGGTVLNNSASTPSTLTVNVAASDTYGGLVANGAGGLTLVKSGAGTLILTGANTYSGGTSINAGTVQLGTGAAGLDGSLGSGAVANSGALVYNLNGSQTANYAITGPGSLTTTGPGTLALTNTNNAYTGGTTLGNGILNFAANSLPGTITFAGGTLQWATGNTQDISAAIAPVASGQAAIFDAGAGNSVTLNSSISGAGGLTKTGSGLLTLAAPNSYGSITTVSGGTLQVANQSALGTSGLLATSGSGVLDLNGYSLTLSSLTGAGGTVLNNSASTPSTLTLNVTGSSAYGGVLANGLGTLALTKSGAGTLTLGGASTYSGATVIRGGTLRLTSVPTALTNQTFTSDATALIGTTSPYGPGNYTVALAFNQTQANPPTGSSNVTINGQTFTDTGTATSGSNWFLGTGGTSWPTTNFGNNAHGTFPGGFPLTAGMGTYTLLNSFDYETTTANPETLTVTGLTPGISYDARLYYRSWGNPTDTRAANLVFGVGSGSQQETINNLNEDADASAHYLNYTYTATSSSMEVSITPVVSGYSWHVYGFSNQQASAGASILPTMTPVSIAVGSILDLAGASQQVASLSDFTPGSGGSVINSSTAAISVLTLSPPAGSTTFSGQILGANVSSGYGTVGLVMSGTGTQVLAGANTYNGGTTVNGGTLQMGNSAALGTSGMVVTSGAGVLNLNGYSLALSSLTGAGGTILNSSASTQSLLTVNVAGMDTYGGAVTNGAGTMALVKSGFGTLVLTGNNTYSGGTTVGGTLQVGTGLSGQDGSLGSGTVANSGALVYNLYGAQTAAYAVTGPGSLTMTGPGTLMLTNTNSNYGGGTTLGSGILNFAANSLPGSITFAGGTLQWATGNAQDISGQIAAVGNGYSAVLDTNGNNNVTLSNAIGGLGGLTKAGAGTLTLAAANTFSGNTLVSGGTLALGNAAALQNSTLDTSGSGTLGFAGGLTATTLGGIINGGNINLTNANSAPVALSVGNNNHSTTYSGVLSGSGGLDKVGSGTLILTTAQAYNGGTTVSGGTLQLKASVPAPAGALATYTFNGNTNDSSGNGNNGTAQGGPAYVAGPAAGQQALNFNGTSQWVSVPYAANLSVNSWTVSAWINLAAGLNGNNGILGTRFNGDNTYDVKILGDSATVHSDIGSGGGWMNTAADAAYAPTFAAGTGTWYMVTETVNSDASYSIYVNGALVGSGGAAGTPPALLMKPGQTMGIGQDFGGEFFTGSLADVYVYGSALTAGQITSLYQSVANPVANNLLPGTTAMTVANGSVFDLGGNNQQLASLSDPAGGSGGSVVNSNTGSASLLTLSPTDGATHTFSGLIAGGGSYGTIGLVMNGTGTQVLAGANTFTGGTTISAGTLALGNSLALQYSTLGLSGSGALSFGGLTAATLGGLTGGGNLTLTNTASAPVALSVGNNNANTSYSGTINGSGSLIKVGIGTLTVTGSQTYSGPTVIRAGTLQLVGGVPSVASTGSFTSDANSGIGALGTTNYTEALAIGQGASLTINGVTFANANNTSGTGNLGSSWSFSPAIANGGPNGPSGNFAGGFPLTSDQGTYNLLNHFYYEGSATPVTLTLTGLQPGYAYDARIYYRAWANVDDRSVNWTFSNGISQQALWVNEDANTGANYVDYQYTAGPTGTVTLSETNSATMQAGGSWHWYGFSNQQIGGSFSVLPTTTALSIAAGASLDMNGSNQQVASLSDVSGSGGSVINSLAALTPVLTLSSTGGTTTFSGQIGGGSGTVGLVMSGAGTQILNGNNTYTAGTSVNGGRLVIGPAGNINSTSGISIGAGDFRYNSTTPLAVTPLFAATGGVLSGSGSITPDVTITAGNTLAPGDGANGGTLTLGNLTLADSGGVAVDNPGSSLALVTGNYTDIGSHTLSVAGAATPGTPYTFLQWNTQTGVTTGPQSNWSVSGIRNWIGPASGNWTDSTQWDGCAGGSVTATAQTLYFTVTSGPPASTNDVVINPTASNVVVTGPSSGPVVVNSLQVGGTNLSSPTLNLGAADFNVAAAVNVVGNGTLAATAGGSLITPILNVNGAGASATLGGPDGNVGTANVSGGGSITTIGGAIATFNSNTGAGTSTIGLGTTVTTANIYGGNVNFNSAQANNGTLALSGGTVNFGSGATVATANFSAGAGTANATTNPLAITNTLLMPDGITTATVSAGNSFAAGGANLASASAASTLTLSGGTVTVAAGGNGLNLPNTSLNLAAATSFAAPTAVASTLGGLTFSSPGANLTLTAGGAGTSVAFSNIYAAASAGIVNDTNDMTQLVVPSGSTFGAAGGQTLTVGVQIVDPTSGGSSGVVAVGPGTVALANSNNTYSGGTTVQGGTLSFVPGSLPQMGTVVSDPAAGGNSTATILWAAGPNGANTTDLSSNGPLTLNSGTTKFDLSGAQGYPVVFDGTVSGNGNMEISGGTLQFGGYAFSTTGILATTGSVTIDAGAILTFSHGDNLVVSNNIGGQGSLTHIGNGTLILTGSDTYTGGTTVYGGPLQIGNGGSSGSLAGNIYLPYYYSSLLFNRTGTVTAPGNISGAGSLTQEGSGTLILSGTNTYSGGTSVENGLLVATNPKAISGGSLLDV
ncbi:MAG: autotransporter-associated beta strand repeat-containing protein, partial [Thermoguttaceae bacterium]